MLLPFQIHVSCEKKDKCQDKITVARLRVRWEMSHTEPSFPRQMKRIVEVMERTGMSTCFLSQKNKTCFSALRSGFASSYTEWETVPAQETPGGTKQETMTGADMTHPADCWYGATDMLHCFVLMSDLTLRGKLKIDKEKYALLNKK